MITFNGNQQLRGKVIKTHHHPAFLHLALAHRMITLPPKF